MAFLLMFPSPSLVVTAMSIISASSLTLGGISEIKGKHMQYSKFWKIDENSFKKPSNKQIILSSKKGMLLAYTPAFLAAAASFFIVPDQDLRFILVKSALYLHFFKRILEVLFIHKFSGGMVLDTAKAISLSYFTSTVMIIYSQYITQGLQQPPIDLKYIGIPLFLIGLGGNLYHHYLLSQLRSKDGDKEYKIPKGGLFELVICPHYLFEIIDLFGISFISQTMYAFSFAIGSAFYLTGRSYATKRWYCSKTEDFPSSVKVLIPFIF